MAARKVKWKRSKAQGGQAVARTPRTAVSKAMARAAAATAALPPVSEQHLSARAVCLCACVCVGPMHVCVSMCEQI